MKTNTIAFVISALTVCGLFLVGLHIAPKIKSQARQAEYTPLPPTDTTPPYRPAPPPSDDEPGSPNNAEKDNKIAFYYSGSKANRDALDAFKQFCSTKQGQAVATESFDMNNPLTAVFHKHDLSKGAKLPAYLCKVKGKVAARLENGQPLTEGDLESLALKMFKVDKDGRQQEDKVKQ